MSVILKNNRNYTVNLGTIKGNMLLFGPYETKTIEQEMFENFEKKITSYVEGGFLHVIEVKKNPIVIDKSTKPTIKERKQ